MNEIKTAYYRGIQTIMKFAMKLVKFKEPKEVSGVGSVNKLNEILKENKCKKPLFVVSKTILKSGKLDNLLNNLSQNDLNYKIYDSVKPNPSVDNIEECLSLYEKEHCDAIVAIGGGSPIDCAKVVAARAANKNLSIKELRGFFKVKNNITLLIAVPTTAGSGSEATVAAVVTDSTTHEKYAVTDLKLVPDYAILDPELTVGVPKPLTAATGMDALTHAVEAYIGRSGSKFTDERAVKATKLIIENLEVVYENGQDINGRNSMLIASFYAGQAFTRAYVGYVHAIAHSIGGVYGVAHGLLNAIILPKVLEYYGETAYDKLATLAIKSNLGNKDMSKKVLALKFINKIKDMNKAMNIPTFIKEIRKEDIELLAKRAIKEANPVYPVPKIMNVKECEKLISSLMLITKS